MSDVFLMFSEPPVRPENNVTSVVVFLLLSVVVVVCYYVVVVLLQLAHVLLRLQSCSKQ